MKKIAILSMVIIIFLSCVACSNNQQNKTQMSTQIPTENTEPEPTTVPDNGSIEYEKTYTMEEMLEIKTSWNIKYVFPTDFDNVKIDKKDETNLKMSLTTSKVNYVEAREFYKTYTIGKQKLNATDTGESFFVSFEEDYVSRTIMVVDNGDNVVITVTYSMDNVNKR